MRPVTLLEELSLNALPALRTLHLDGWVLRFGGGYSKRANAVHPLYPPAGALSVEKKLGICERLYRAQAQPPIFKLTEGAYPDGLDDVLAERGYHCLATTSVQTRSLATVDPPDDSLPGILHSAPDPVEPWLDAAARIGQMEAERRQLLSQLLPRIVPPARYVWWEMNGEIVAVGYGVNKAGFVGLFQLGTALDHRRRGYARAVTRDLLEWGRAEGAHTAYLQVVCTNEPALRLYQDMGFTEQYQYWYRIGDNGAGGVR